MSGQAAAVSVPGLLALLEACGAHVTAGEGEGLALTGKRPPAPLLEQVKARKAEVLAYLRGQVEDPAKEEAGAEGGAAAGPSSSSPHGQAAGGEVVTKCDNLPAPHEDPEGREDLPGVSSADTGTRPARPDWEKEAARAGRCGSCARALPAPDWGPLMVTCGADPVAWWPLPPPFALHVGARCGAYLMPGEEIGRGYRSKEAAKTWGAGLPARPVARPAAGRGGQI